MRLLTCAFCLWMSSLAEAAELTKSLEFAPTSTGIVRVELGKEYANFRSVEAKSADGKSIPAQLTAPSLRAGTDVAKELYVALPTDLALKGGSLALRFSETAAASSGGWTDESGKSRTLTMNGKPILRYMHEALDESTPARQMETMKVYHHVFAPDGKTLLTKGHEGEGNDFPHHRGIYFGFNRISYGKQTADVWHCRKGESQGHAEIIREEVGPVLGRQVVRILWNGPDKKPFATEEREVTAFPFESGTLIAFETRLTTSLPLVKLDGDPQHAGIQYRAPLEVKRKTAAQTYYLRPDGKGALKETRNYDIKTKKGPVNEPWGAMSFVLGEDRYTVTRIEHPDNPKETRHSERDYGRFGSYFEYDLTPQKPLRVSILFRVQKGETTLENCQAWHAAYSKPPKAEIK